MQDNREKIIAVCLDVLEMERHEIGLDDEFRSFSHIDSLKALDLMSALEKNFKIKLPERELREFISLAKVVEVVERHLAQTATA
ncbi:acyl carrier protein [Oxalobacteraceae bacterium GrIS 1.11]